tara:strand:- start:786 stop:1004 length:219 start_codon:yes stop_codon:yes gene_type:complete
MRDSFRPIHNNFITQDNQKKNSEDFRRRQNGRVMEKMKMLDPIVDMTNEYKKVRSNKTTIPKSVIRGTTSSR